MIDRRTAKVQATEVSYELHSLGWKAFQNLCVTITGEIWGQTVQSFCDSHDGGRDGAFQGKWISPEGPIYDGTYTAQCKYTAKSSKQLQISDLKDELEKARRLASKGLADNYILFTNARLTGVVEESLKAAFESIPGIKHFLALGVDRISLLIRDTPRLRMLVPRVYGLGDLSQILDERAYDQAQEILSSLGDDLAKFVITESFNKSAKALDTHGFVLLLGEPACGKSTIAAALAVGSLDTWKCQTIKVRNAAEFVRHSNPKEKQFFWVDDAFGATQIDFVAASAWSQALPHVQAAIKRGSKVLFTSRDYIYRSARSYLKENALPIMRESQVVINVQDLSLEEREQILYNHIRLGTQQKQFKSEIKPYLLTVSENSSFSPEIARRLGNPAFTKGLLISKVAVQNFVENPKELLLEILRTIDSESLAALALVFMRAGVLPSPLKLTTDEKRAMTLVGGTLAGVRKALGSLDGSLLVKTYQSGMHIWRHKHPTVRDSFAALVAEDLELMDVYLAGSPVQTMFSEITCGYVEIEGVKVVVPVDRFDIVIERLDSIDITKWDRKSELYRFLSHRCSREFLTKYVKTHPSFVANLRVMSQMYFVADMDIAARLNEFGLLPEEHRQRLVEAIKRLAVDTPDAGFLLPPIRKIISANEMKEILSRVECELLPNLDEKIDEWESAYDPDEDPESHFYDFERALNKFEIEFFNNSDALQQIKSAQNELKSAIERMRARWPERTSSNFFDGESHAKLSQERSRSIFDDVDS